MAKKRSAKSRTPALPGMEDRTIAAIEQAAQEYAEVRDERLVCEAREVQLRTRLLRVMKSHHKDTYLRDGIKIEVIHEREKVRVHIPKPKLEEPQS